MIKQYRKKPVAIEAMQFLDAQDIQEILDWCPSAVYEGFEDSPLFIKTLEGEMHVTEGDYIIKGIKGEFYPCKPDIFAATYELAPNKA